MWPMCRAELLASVCALGAVLAGCRQDMHDQRKVEPLEPSLFFDDGRGAREPVEGTVARGLAKDDPHLWQGRSGGQLVEEFPYEMNQERILRGRERFDIYCSPCHARTGDGDGMIVRRGFQRPPSLTSPEMRAKSVGHFFEVATKGFGVMPAYAAQIPVDDRWAIVAYVRALQLSRAAPLEDLPPAVRRELGAEGGSP